MFRGSMDQWISPHKPQIRNPRKIHYRDHPFISNHSENLSPPNVNTVSLLQAPPPFPPRSYPPYLFQQPPLLPLPAAKHRLSPTAGKEANGGNNRARDTSLTPRKSKVPKKLAEKTSKRVVGSPTSDHLGSDPNDLSNRVVKVVTNKPFVSSNMFDDANNQVDLFSGSAMLTISPPPSSLPLPTFSMRPKISCRVAAGIDHGATDDLRRLLRLR